MAAYTDGEVASQLGGRVGEELVALAAVAEVVDGDGLEWVSTLRLKLSLDLKVDQLW